MKLPFAAAILVISALCVDGHYLRWVPSLKQFGSHENEETSYVVSNQRTPNVILTGLSAPPEETRYHVVSNQKNPNVILTGLSAPPEEPNYSTISYQGSSISPRLLLTSQEPPQVPYFDGLRFEELPFISRWITNLIGSISDHLKDLTDTQSPSDNQNDLPNSQSPSNKQHVSISISFPARYTGWGEPHWDDSIYNPPSSDDDTPSDDNEEEIEEEEEEEEQSEENEYEIEDEPVSAEQSEETEEEEDSVEDEHETSTAPGNEEFMWQRVRVSDNNDLTENQESDGNEYKVEDEPVSVETSTAPGNEEFEWRRIIPGINSDGFTQTEQFEDTEDSNRLIFPGDLV